MDTCAGLSESYAPTPISMCNMDNLKQTRTTELSDVNLFYSSFFKPKISKRVQSRVDGAKAPEIPTFPEFSRQSEQDGNDRQPLYGIHTMNLNNTSSSYGKTHGNRLIFDINTSTKQRRNQLIAARRHNANIVSSTRVHGLKLDFLLRSELEPEWTTLNNNLVRNGKFQGQVPHMNLTSAHWQTSRYFKPLPKVLETVDVRKAGRKSLNVRTNKVYTNKERTHIKGVSLPSNPLPEWKPPKAKPKIPGSKDRVDSPDSDSDDEHTSKFWVQSGGLLGFFADTGVELVKQTFDAICVKVKELFDKLIDFMAVSVIGRFGTIANARVAKWIEFTKDWASDSTRYVAQLVPILYDMFTDARPFSLIVLAAYIMRIGALGNFWTTLIDIIKSFFQKDETLKTPTTTAKGAANPQDDEQGMAGEVEIGIIDPAFSSPHSGFVIEDASDCVSTVINFLTKVFPVDRELTQKIQLFNSCATAVRTVKNFVLWIFEILPDWLTSWYNKSNQCKWDESLAQPTGTFQTFVYLSMTMRATIEAGSIILPEIKAAWLESYIDMQKALADPTIVHKPAVIQTFNRYKYLDGVNARTGSQRIEPMWTYFYGDPGIGKSAMLSSIIGFLYDKPASKVTDVAFFRNSGTDFYDGYRPKTQKVLVHDDLGAVNSPINPSGDYIDLIPIVSVAPFPLPMSTLDNAEIGIKGTLSEFEMVMTCSNSAVISPVEVRCPEALNRRIQFKIHVTRNPGAATDLISFSHLTFHIEKMANHTVAICSCGQSEDVFCTRCRLFTSTTFNYYEICRVLKIQKMIREATHRRVLKSNDNIVHPPVPKKLDDTLERFITLLEEGNIPLFATRGKRFVYPPKVPVVRNTEVTGSEGTVEEEHPELVTQGLTDSIRENFFSYATDNLWTCRYFMKKPARTLAGLVFKYFAEGAAITFAAMSAESISMESLKPFNGFATKFEVIIALIKCISAVGLTFAGAYYLITPAIQKVSNWIWRDDREEFIRMQKELTELTTESYENTTLKPRKPVAPPLILEDASSMDGLVKLQIYPQPSGEAFDLKGYLLHSRCLITSAHSFYKSTCKDAPSFNIRMEYLARGVIKTRAMDVPRSVMRIHPSKDLIFIDLTNFNIEAARDHRSLLHGPNMPSAENITVTMHNFDGTCVSRQVGTVRLLKVDHGVGNSPLTLKHYLKGYKGNLKTAEGDCGSILTNPAGKIIGLHYGASRKGELQFSYALPLSSSDLQYDPSAFVEINPEIELQSEEHEWHNPGPQDSVELIGKLTKTETHYQNPVSTVMPSVIHGLLTTPVNAPPILSRYDPRNVRQESPLQNGIGKYYNEVKSVSNRNLMAAKDCLRIFINMESRVLPGVLNIHQVLNGDPNIPYCRGLDMSKSCGNGYKATAKHKLEYIEGEPGSYYIPEQGLLDRNLNQGIEDSMDGILKPAIVIDTLKDERVSLQKIEAVKTRVFQQFPLDVTIDSALCFGKLICHAIALHEVDGSPFAMGINPYSRAWDDKISWMLEVGKLGFDGDGVSFDANYTIREFIGVIADLSIEWIEREHPLTEKERKRYKIVFFRNFSTVHKAGTFCYKTSMGTNSGSLLTTFVNSCVMIMHLYIAYYRLVPAQLANPAAFQKLVHMLVYGDDHIVSVSPTIQDLYHFNSVRNYFTLMGCGYTCGTKNVNETRSLWPVLSMSFLKNGTGRMNNRFVPLMQIKVITEMVNWIRKGDMSPLEATITVAQDSLRFMFFYGRKIFDQWRNKLISVLPTGSFVDFDTYADIFEMYGQLESSTDDDVKLPLLEGLETQGRDLEPATMNIPKPQSEVCVQTELQKQEKDLKIQLATAQKELGQIQREIQGILEAQTRNIKAQYRQNDSDDDVISDEDVVLDRLVADKLSKMNISKPQTEAQVTLVPPPQTISMNALQLSTDYFPESVVKLEHNTTYSATFPQSHKDLACMDKITTRKINMGDYYVHINIQCVAHKGKRQAKGPGPRPEFKVQSELLHEGANILGGIIDELIPHEIQKDALGLLGALDYPTVPNFEAITRVKHYDNWNTYKGVNRSVPLRHDPKTMTLTDKYHFRAGDAMSLKKLMTMPCTMAGETEAFTTWTNTDVPGTILYWTHVSPNVELINSYASLIAGTTCPSALGQLSTLFQNWRGSIRYTIKVFSSTFHQGSLRASFHPGIYSPIGLDTSAKQSSQYFLAMDFNRKTSEYTVDVPFMALYPWLATLNTTGEGNMAGLEPRYFTGILVISVIKRLKNAGQSSPTIKMRVQISAGEDFQVANITQHGISVNQSLSHWETHPFTVQSGSTTAGPSAEIIGEDTATEVTSLTATALTTQNVEPIESNVVPTDVTGDLSHRQACSMPENAWTLAEAQEKMTEFATVEWSDTNPDFTVLGKWDVPNDLMICDLTSIARDRFLYWSTKTVDVYASISANEFQCGAVALVWAPLVKPDNFPAVGSVTTGFYSRKAQIDFALHGIIEPKMDSDVKIQIPFIHPQTFLNLAAGDSLGTLLAIVYDQTPALAGVGPMTISMHSSITEGRVFGPRPCGDTSNHISSGDGFRVQSKVTHKANAPVVQAAPRPTTTLGKNPNKRENKNIKGTRAFVEHFEDRVDDIQELIKKFAPAAVVEFAITNSEGTFRQDFDVANDLLWPDGQGMTERPWNGCGFLGYFGSLYRGFRGDIRLKFTFQILAAPGVELPPDASIFGAITYNAPTKPTAVSTGGAFLETTTGLVTMLGSGPPFCSPRAPHMHRFICTPQIPEIVEVELPALQLGQFSVIASYSGDQANPPYAMGEVSVYLRSSAASPLHVCMSVAAAAGDAARFGIPWMLPTLRTTTGNYPDGWNTEPSPLDDDDSIEIISPPRVHFRSRADTIIDKNVKSIPTPTRTVRK